ncbi:MAG: molybdopterin-containing oxidoreductase family iron-sulfur binding subunit [Ilumatobacter sp.]
MSERGLERINVSTVVSKKSVAKVLAIGPLALAAFFAAGITPAVVIPVLLITIGLVSVPYRLRRGFRRPTPVSAAAPHVAPSSGVTTVTPVTLTKKAYSRREALTKLGLGSVAIATPAIGLPALTNSWKDGTDPGKGPATGPSGRTRQWGMLIDLRLCDGCQSQGTPPQCTTSCIEGHFAPEPMEWIELYEAELHGGGTQFIPTPCQQCQSPPCVNVCPVNATFSTPEGPVLIDQNRCIGCRMCMAACPYDRRFFNWGNAPIPPEALLADYKAEHQVPAKKGTVMKCDFCPEMARAGSLPFCVQACPNDAIYYGDLEEDIATNGRDVVSFSTFAAENNSYRLKEDLGTEPRVHYIPGHGELVGRDRLTTGRLATKWPWIERVKGAVTWSR